MPVSAHDFERDLAVDFLLQPPQRTIHRFAFFQSYFGQRNSLPFQRNPSFREFKMGAQSGFSAPIVNVQILILIIIMILIERRRFR